MKRSPLLFSTIICLTILQSCSSSRVKTALDEEVSRLSSVYQEGVEVKLTELVQEVQIRRRKFSLRFYNKKYNRDKGEFYSAQIAALLNRADFDKVQVGASTKDLSWYESGTGMAPSRTGKYDELIFTTYGHHYTTYSDSGRSSLDLLEEGTDLCKFEFDISNLNYDNKVEEVRNSKMNTFYITILIDSNRNKIIDKGELNKIIIKFL